MCRFLPGGDRWDPAPRRANWESLLAEQIGVQGDPEPDRVHCFVQVGRLVPERQILAYLFVRTARTRSLPSHTRFLERAAISGVSRPPLGVEVGCFMETPTPNAGLADMLNE